MPTLPQEEKKLTFGEVARQLSSKPTRKTVENWHRFGLYRPGTRYRVFLEASYEGGHLYTSWEAYLRFEALLNEES